MAAPNSGLTPQGQLQQMIQQYQLMSTSIANIRQALERPDLTPENRQQLQAQELQMQNRLQIYQNLFNNITPRLTQAQQASLSHQLSVMGQQQQQHQQQQQQQQQPPHNVSMPDNAAFLAQQQQQQQQQVHTQPPASSTPQPQHQQPTPIMTNTSVASPTTPTTTVSQQRIGGGAPASVVNNTNGSTSASSKQGTPVVTPTKGMFTFPTMSGPPLSSANSMAAAAAAAKPPPSDENTTSKVLGKRQIQELAGQIDPAERLEPEVENILLDIADEFIESVTKFACRLAKHRKSDTLEVKDLQLHLERNWNVRIPGFASEEIRSLRKPVIPTTHQAKVQAVNLARTAAAQQQSATKKDN